MGLSSMKSYEEIIQHLPDVQFFDSIQSSVSMTMYPPFSEPLANS